MKTFVQRTDSRPDWETPQPLFDALDAEFGFTLDAAATPENAKCEDYITPEMNALTVPWLGTVWLNPPYGREVGVWVEKALAEAQRGATVVCLIPSRTDAAWWHDFVMPFAEVRFVRGRIRFIGAPYNAPFPSAVVVFRSASHTQGVSSR